MKDDELFRIMDNVPDVPEPELSDVDELADIISDAPEPEEIDLPDDLDELTFLYDGLDIDV